MKWTTSSVHMGQPCSPSSLESLGDVCQGNCKSLECREGVLEVQCIGVGVDATKLHHLLVEELDLEVLGGLLRDAAAKVQLVHLAVLVPHGGLVVHDKLQLAGLGRVVRVLGALLALVLLLLLELLSQLRLLEGLQRAVLLRADGRHQAGLVAGLAVRLAPVPPPTPQQRRVQDALPYGRGRQRPLGGLLAGGWARGRAVRLPARAGGRAVPAVRVRVLVQEDGLGVVLALVPAHASPRPVHQRHHVPGVERVEERPLLLGLDGHLRRHQGRERAAAVRGLDVRVVRRRLGRRLVLLGGKVDE